MNDRLDVVPADQSRHQLLVADVADDERNAVWDCPSITSGEVIEHHNTLATVDEL